MSTAHCPHMSHFMVSSRVSIYREAMFYYYFSADLGVVPQPQSVLPFESRFEKERKKRVCCVCLPKLPGKIYYGTNYTVQISNSPIRIIEMSVNWCKVSDLVVGR
ncbi:hypothetical protein BofuT4_P022390.1 [Botrytis cinerea T4]|uniref:Uncharacterized protein n=1 Tax=Botryotinia fuckeliana (strain T4) TaxID=999810 RepID=G2YGT7_BOTF4|nr:hypothetical protein BofuT4_P022390.1 [Botrytis cinerea T4]